MFVAFIYSFIHSFILVWLIPWCGSSTVHYRMFKHCPWPSLISFQHYFQSCQNHLHTWPNILAWGWGQNYSWSRTTEFGDSEKRKGTAKHFFASLRDFTPSNKRHLILPLRLWPHHHHFTIIFPHWTGWSPAALSPHRGGAREKALSAGNGQGEV